MPVECVVPELVKARRGIEARASAVFLWLLRVSLAASFLSAVADRSGLWGPPEALGVAWGAWAPFVEYVGMLNWFLPEPVLDPLACIATVSEVVIAIGLLLGWQLRLFAFAAGTLLASFAITMTISTGIKGPLDYSVFTAAAASLLVAASAGETSWRGGRKPSASGACAHEAAQGSDPTSVCDRF